MTIEYIYLDVECTADGGPDNDSPEAHWDVNKPLLVGWKAKVNSRPIVFSDFTEFTNEICISLNKGRTPCIVAHNAKFDLKYWLRELREDPLVYLLVKDKVKCWDTMTYEYRATGHVEKMISLEDLAKRHQIKFKKSLNLGALLQAGTKMQDISRELLEEYLVEDIEVLEKIHKAQLQDGYECNMDYLFPLAEMELNGLTLDIPNAEIEMQDLIKTTDHIEKKFIHHIKQSCQWQDGTPIIDDDFTSLIGTKSKTIKPMSPRTLSFLLTGMPNTLQITPKWSVRYKKGYGAYYNKTLPSYFGAGNDGAGYSMDESVLSQDASWQAKETLEYRHANKILSTYLSPMISTAKVQGTVHPKLNTAVTNTGRLSSSSPNGQNIPPSVRKLIKAYYGTIIEIDFSQLEMVAVACISQDRNLIADLRDGVDIHYNTAKAVFGKDNAKAMRKIAKNVNFGVLYGGKATGLSHQTGVDRAKVQRLIDAFYKNYPGVGRWQKKLFNDVVDQMQPYRVRDGEQQYRSEYTLPISNRKFTFIEQRSPAWLRRKTGRKWSFSPQQTSNYPIQGFAGGDIVMEALTRLWRKLGDTETKFIMTVHDSIILDSKERLNYIIRTMDGVVKEVAQHFKLPLELKFDVTQDTTWQ